MTEREIRLNARDLSGLVTGDAIPSAARRARVSTWDRTGGNNDSSFVPPGATQNVAQAEGAGRITHLWATALAPDLLWGRSLVLRAYWDGEETPSVEVPFGDFFGAGNCVAGEFASELLSVAPRDARSYHAWFEMPFADGFRLEVENQSDLPLLALYLHIDHESWPEQPRAERFHAWWNRTPARREEDSPGVYGPQPHASRDGNHVFADIRGAGHYLGAFLYVHSTDGGWYGEGDEMIFIDDDRWPPAIHGTGTEDWAGTAWSPAEPFSHPWYGQPVTDRPDWSGFSHLYRFHVADPIRFDRSLHASIERGHANDRDDDWSSVAYWYQRDRTVPVPRLPPPDARVPPWPSRAREAADSVHQTFARELADPSALGDGDATRLGAAASYLAHLAHARDWDRIVSVCDWLSGRPTRSRAAPKRPALPPIMQRVADAGADAASSILEDEDPDAVADAIVGAWVAGFDADAAEGMSVVIGFRITVGDREVARELVVDQGRCAARTASGGHRRLELSGDAETLAALTLGRIDPWEAFIRGALGIAGDTSFAFRFGVFGVKPPAL